MKRGSYKKGTAKDETYMDWEIASTKAFVCIRRFKDTNDPRWLDVATDHLRAASGLCSEFMRCQSRISDPLDWAGIRQSVGDLFGDLGASLTFGSGKSES